MSKDQLKKRQSDKLDQPSGFGGFSMGDAGKASNDQSKVRFQ